MKILSATLALMLCSFIKLGATNYTVNVTDYKFTPATITIQVGDMVTWNFQEGTHTATSGTGCTLDGAFDSGTKQAGSTFSFTFNVAKSYSYYCTFHCSMGMTGSVVVNGGNSGITEAGKNIPSVASIFPNPFANDAHIAYQLQDRSKVDLLIYAMDGKLMKTIHNTLPAGNTVQDVELNDVPAGIYLAHIVIEGVPAEELYLVKK